MTTQADLQHIAGSRSRSPVRRQLVDALNAHCAEYGVTHQQDLADLLAHICVETGGFTKLVESMNYSAEALPKVFGSRITAMQAKQYGRTKAHPANQPAIANIVYGGSWGKRNLGNEYPDDGWNYRGRGPGQATGRANYGRAESLTGIPFIRNPDLMADPDKGTIATLALWQHWNMNKYQGGSDASRKKWNGGTHGLADYKKAYARAMQRRLTVPEPAPKMPEFDMARFAPVEQVIDDADKGFFESGTNVASLVGGGTGLGAVGTSLSFVNYIQHPAVQIALIISLVVGGFCVWYVISERRRKAKLARQAKAAINDQFRNPIPS